MMTVDDYKFTQKYLHQYGNAVVLAIKNRIREDKLIDTGDLLNSINYDVVMTNTNFKVVFKMGDGRFKKGSGLPSEYGVYQDQGTIYIDPHYFFTAPIPGLTKTIFKQKLKEAMTKDVTAYTKKQIKELFKDTK